MSDRRKLSVWRPSELPSLSGSSADEVDTEPDRQSHGRQVGEASPTSRRGTALRGIYSRDMPEAMDMAGSVVASSRSTWSTRWVTSTGRCLPDPGGTGPGARRGAKSAIKDILRALRAASESGFPVGAEADLAELVGFTDDS